MTFRFASQWVKPDGIHFKVEAVVITKDLVSYGTPESNKIMLGG